MRVGLDLSLCLANEPSGIPLYASSLAQALLKEGPEHEYLACLRLSCFPRRHLIPSWIRKRFTIKYYCDRIDPWLSRRVDLFHGLASRVGRFGKTRQVVTLHDVVHLWQDITDAKGAERRNRRYQAVREKADVILTPSEYERARIIEHLGVSPDRVRAIPLAPSPGFVACTKPRNAESPELASLPSDYVLFVGVLQKRKNIIRLMRAMARVAPKLTLVLAGPVYSGFRAELEACVASTKLNVVRLGYVDNAMLPSLFAGALCTCVVSEYESFGIPVVEAMSCGSPVICSQAGALPEVGGNAVEYCEHSSEDSIAFALEKVLGSEATRRRMRAAGLERASQYSYTRTALETLGVYRSLG